MESQQWPLKIAILDIVSIVLRPLQTALLRAIFCNHEYNWSSFPAVVNSLWANEKNNIAQMDKIYTH